MTKDAFDR